MRSRVPLSAAFAFALVGCNTATLTYPPDNVADADLDACFFFCGDGGDATAPESDAGDASAVDAPASDAPADAPADAGRDAPATTDAPQDAPRDGAAG